MPGPTFVAASFGSALPSGTANGDLVLAFVLSPGGSPYSPGAGWTQLDQVTVQGPDFYFHYTAQWCRYSGVEVMPYGMLCTWRDAANPEAWHLQGYPASAYPTVNDGVVASAGSTLVFGARSDVAGSAPHPFPPSGFTALPVGQVAIGFEDADFAVLADLVGWGGGATGALSGEFDTPTASALVSIGPGLQPPVNTVAPAISGSRCVGNTLACSTGSWTNNPTSYTYQWYRLSGGVWSPIGTGSSTYVSVSADIGHYLTCNVTAANAAGSAVANDGGNQVIITAPPVNTSLPTLTGTAYVGQTLITNGGVWGNAPTSYGYQWLRDGAAIAGATGSTYVLTRADRGHKVSVTTTATNGCGSAAATSAQTPTIMGGSLTMLM